MPINDWENTNCFDIIKIQLIKQEYFFSIEIVLFGLGFLIDNCK